MQGTAQPLYKFFDGWDTKLVIPLYQRNYDWKIDNCKQLFKDLLSLHSEQRATHFFGSIVSQVDQGTLARYIIDGQQRLTTISLLLLAMANAHKEGALAAKAPTAGENLINRYIINATVSDEKDRIKLHPIEHDRKAYEALVPGLGFYRDETSNVTRNYNYLYQQVIESGLTLDELERAVQRLQVISINLERDDDPQLIFESLNSTGLDLSEADKVRNYLLMSQSPNEQQRFYRQYWQPIEQCTDYDPTPFLRDYLTLQRGSIVKTSSIYTEFKTYDTGHQFQREDLLADLLHYAQIYQHIVRADFGQPTIDAKLRQMHPIGLNVAYPFLMAFFDYADKNGLTPEAQVEVLHLVETYWVRRLICERPSNALNKVFMTLHHEVAKQLTDSEATYIAVATYFLRQRTGRGELPRDEEVEQKLATREVYKMPPGAREFILERFENQDSKELRHDIAQGLKDEKISIEHIMPQTLSSQWKDALGHDWERIHRTYLHTLANLTVTAYNSNYSNATFRQKRDMEHGFSDSPYRLNAYVRDCEQWTETELLERQQQQLAIFMRLWPEPQTDFVPAAPPTDSASLDDEDFEGTGRALRAYSYRGVTHEASKWFNMIVEVSALVYRDCPATVTQLCASGKWRYATEPATGRTEFATGLYVHTSSSTADKLRILRHLFEACDIPVEELVFELQPQQDDTVESE